MLVEKGLSVDEKLFVVIDSFTLKVLSEQAIETSDLERTFENEDDLGDQLDDTDSYYATKSDSPRYLNWNKGR